MKKMLLVGGIIGVFGLFWFGNVFWFGEKDISHAQVSDEEYQKRLERDKNVPQEKVDKAFAEAKKIQDDILAIIAEKKPEFKFYSKYSLHLISDDPGRRGKTNDYLSWRTNKTELSINFILGITKEDQLASFHHSLDTISMGEFFAVPNIGDEAVLVKNVLYNKKTTYVGLHFIKGRAQVKISVINHKRTTEKNEKELMEVIRLIEPLIIARENFDD